ncbi:Phosphoglycerate kinase [Pyrolobus fumarii 1A]|uniref:Phosphoglycerate kinase n=1 Tax=Pyrolobus fumarii (strain DSM 11204 / 1A) TaxID=694429 RepID=G0EGC0_PYRF1|nr:phosphoglycerate kinase [Pyrolobus fumarii]AEM39145.1 Phosphoglycerate kinase [Pyrolobus fumarii 1A]
MGSGAARLPLIEDLENHLGGLKGKKLLVRVDFNSPVNPQTGEIIDYSRIEAHVPTLRELLERGAALVVISHQGKPGSSDFITLEQHASILSKLLGVDVAFVDDVIGPAAREAIKKLEPGSILMLDNTRLLSEEVIEAPPEKHAKTIFVKRLAPLFDGYINDAFAAIHRSQPSIVGFPMLLPSAAGRLVQREMDALSKIFNPSVAPKVFVLGGGKVTDSVKIVEALLERKVADYILTGGLLATLLLHAKGVDIGEKNVEVLKSAGVNELVIEKARRLIEAHKDVIVTPVDFKVEIDGEVETVNVGEPIRGYIRDIGPETVKLYQERMEGAKLIVMRGPMGVMEDERFRAGTEELVEYALKSGAYVIFGGGHLASVARRVIRSEGIPAARYHISSGGGALLLYLSGKPLPGIEALKLSAAKFYGW